MGDSEDRTRLVMTLVTAMVTGFATSYGYNSIGPGGTISTGEKAALIQTITRLESELKDARGRLDQIPYLDLIEDTAALKAKVEYLESDCKR